MIQVLRSRVNQKLHQADLLLQAAEAGHADPLQQLAWQQACQDAAILALDAACLAFLRELAACYRLQPQAVHQADDLLQQAAAREQQLPELQQWLKAFATRPELQLLTDWRASLDALPQPVDNQLQSAGLIASSSQPVADRSPQKARLIQRALRNLVDVLREGLYEA